MESSPTTPPGTPGSFCTSCGARYDAGARFCHGCGLPTGARTPTSRQLTSLLPWAITVLSVIALVSLLAGRQFGARTAEVTTTTPLQPGGATRAPDISSMSPQERADRLFARVMAFASAGKADSAQFFAPMAIGAFEALSPLSPHNRYDLGLVALAVYDAEIAEAQADSILREHPSHLLGLSLAARASNVKGDTIRTTAFHRRLLAAEASERTRNLPEYTDHADDLQRAISVARGGTP